MYLSIHRYNEFRIQTKFWMKISMYHYVPPCTTMYHQIFGLQYFFQWYVVHGKSGAERGGNSETLAKPGGTAPQSPQPTKKKTKSINKNKNKTARTARRRRKFFSKF